MDYKTVALVGAGAVGSFFIRSLQEKMGDNFCVIAEGERKKRLMANGITINGIPYPVVVKAPEEAGQPDVLIIAVKYVALREAMETVQKIVGKNTIVLTVLNGIDSEAIAAEYIPVENIMPSFMYIIANRNGNSTQFNEANTKGIIFGEKDGKPSERTEALTSLFSSYGLAHRYSGKILEDMWHKYAMNVISNLLQAVFSVGFGVYNDSEHAAYLRLCILKELTAVAAAEGISITGLPTPNSTLAANTRLSTLQDLDAKRTTEIDMLLGALLKRAKQYNIPTPYCNFTYHAIKILEEKNSGKFDY